MFAQRSAVSIFLVAITKPAESVGTIIVNIPVNRNGDTNLQEGDTLSGLHTHTNMLKLGNIKQPDMKKRS